jgi:hypothetical protein
LSSLICFVNRSEGFLVVLCLLEGRVYLELDGLEISGNLCRFLIIDLDGFGVIPSFLDVNK